MDNLEFHPLANIFPLIEGAEFDALKEDIHQNGLLDAITLFDSKIIDGRNRYRAMQELNKEIPGYLLQDESTNFPTQEIALAWVLSKNLHRRHLSEGQRAMVAGNIANMKSGERTDIVQNPEAEPSANLQKVSVADAAKRLNVGARSVNSAKKIIDQGSDELNQAVIQGKIAVSAAAEIATLPEEKQVEIIKSADPKALQKVIKEQRAKNTADKKAKREQREKELGAKQIALPNKKYGVIYADPEWKFETYSEDGLGRAADNHYPTSSLDIIKDRKIADIAANDCVLFLWATVPMLAQALEVMKTWGFEYKSQFIWVKDRIGTGYWSRNKHEILLIGTKGSVPAPAMGFQENSVIEAKVRKHSQKPEVFYRLIESYFPNLPKIELNARSARDGWEAWGLECPPCHSERGEEYFAASKDFSALPQNDNRIDGCLADPHPSPPRKGNGKSLQKTSEQINSIISEGYGAKLPIAQIANRAGISPNAVEKRAARLGLSNINNQRRAVIASNKRRVKSRKEEIKSDS